MMPRAATSPVTEAGAPPLASGSFCLSLCSVLSAALNTNLGAVQNNCLRTCRCTATCNVRGECVMPSLRLPSFWQASSGGSPLPRRSWRFRLDSVEAPLAPWRRHVKERRAHFTLSPYASFFRQEYRCAAQVCRRHTNTCQAPCTATAPPHSPIHRAQG